MYNEIHEHARKDKIKWIAVFTAIILLFVGVISALAISIRVNDTDNAPENPIVTDDGGTNNGEVAKQTRVLLSATPFALTATDERGVSTVSKKITATVLPVDAPDKSVDWSIEWCIPIEGEAVTDYLTVTPDSDGSLTATITAYKGFEGASAYVKATTRVGGFTATCLVGYDGAPESLRFIYNGVEHITSDSIDLVAGTTSNISLNLENTLGAVGSKYGNFEIVSMKSRGKFVMTKEYIINGSVSSSEDIVFDLETSSYTYTNEASGSQQTLTIGTDVFFDASISGDVLTINAKKSEASYVNGYPRTGYRFKYKSAYTDPRSGGVPTDCTWYIVVRDTVSGEECLINIDIESTVTSVSLDTTFIQF